MNEITEPVINLLEGKNFAFFSTLMKDGSPQITPVWIDWDKNTNTILINTAKGRLKQENISRDPRVAVSVADSNNPYEMVTIRGKVIEQNTEGAIEHADKLAKKYMGIDKYPYHSPSEKRIILKIKPEKIYLQQPPK
ncbi:MAG TPA: PPOX class F420-dependent oxidoreductase [Candidatus Sulfopaludibacter sp.]|jgi:PPOX class probable F420-dependent enzyme|nr:PPOX class F420-dependent oxidoreductase [Candidatus Sulfopaludibacter sp.]